MMRFSTHSIVAWLLLSAIAVQSSSGEWTRHTIDDISRGADGVKTADINGDGQLDLVTGWEEGGLIRAYLQPVSAMTTQPWPAVTIGEVGSPEDAVFVDLDRDGVHEVLSCCEGETRGLFVHRCIEPAEMLTPESWVTTPIELDIAPRQWMFAEPWHATGPEVRIIAGAKGDNAELGVLTFQPNRSDDEAWSWEPLQPVGWVMSICPGDYYGNFALDIFFSDRNGSTRGVHWYEAPHGNSREWRLHTIGGTDHEVMFLDTADLDGDGSIEVVCAAKDAGILIFTRDLVVPEEWSCEIIPLGDECGSAKGVAVFDVDRDGDLDIAFSCESAERRIGIGWLSAPDGELNDISGTEQGRKFDLLLPMDVNDDGWIDVITCEERDNLGVIWYENPEE